MQLELLCALIDQLLQRAEGTEPAAVHAAPPEQQRHGDEAPQQEQHRIDEEGFPAKTAHRGVHEGQHLHDGELREREPADEEHRIEQEAAAHDDEEIRVPRQCVLEEQDRGERRQADEQHADLEHARLPHRDP